MLPIAVSALIAQSRVLGSRAKIEPRITRILNRLGKPSRFLSVLFALLSCKFFVACEDFFGLTAQVIHGPPIIGYGNSD